MAPGRPVRRPGAAAPAAVVFRALNTPCHTEQVRIVSLLASATEIVAFLGLEQQLVGVSADSDWPADAVRGLPVLNTVSFNPDQLTSREIDNAASHGHLGASLYHVDAEMLRALRPDLILTQEVCEVCSVSRRDLDHAARMLGYAPNILSLNAVNLEQVFEDIEQVSRFAGVADRAADRLGPLRERLDVVRQRAAGAPQPRVLCMEWLDPPYCAGHWIPEMVELAGGKDELGFPAGPSREVTWSDVTEYAPEVLILMPCSLSLERVASEFAELRGQAGWELLPAVRARRVYVGHTDLFSRSGPRLVDGVEALARMLHPESFEQALPADRALRISEDGQRLQAYR